MRANFPYIHLLLCWLLSSSRTFYDSVMWIGLFPADFLFWALVFGLCIFLKNYWSPSSPLLKKYVDYFSFIVIISWIFLSVWNYCFSSVLLLSGQHWKTGVEMGIFLSMYIRELWGNISTKVSPPTKRKSQRFWLELH